eukprot:6204505-Pleurochrysis_carterae.AAC.2
MPQVWRGGVARERPILRSETTGRRQRTHGPCSALRCPRLLAAQRVGSRQCRTSSLAASSTWLVGRKELLQVLSSQGGVAGGGLSWSCAINGDCSVLALPASKSEEANRAVQTTDNKPDENESANIRSRTLNELDAQIAVLEAELANAKSADEHDHVEARISEQNSPEKNVDMRRKREAGTLEIPLAGRPKQDMAGNGAGSDVGKQSTETAKLSLHCAVCDIRVTSEQLMREHLMGRKHQQAAKIVEARKEGRFCDVCGIVFTGVAQLTEHTKGKRHREAARNRGRRN